MTTVPRPTGRLAVVLDRFLCGLTWATQVGAAGTYAVITIQSAMWNTMWDREPFNTVCLIGMGVGMAALWFLSLREEQKAFFDRTAQRVHRKMVTLGHLGVLLVATVAASAYQNRIGLWIILGLFAFYANVIWAAWMRSRFLPADDQAVIDAIRDREAQQTAAAFDASQKERRRERLSAIVASLGYQLTDTPAQPAPQDEQPADRWQIPARKHDPLVYFLRNGNRLKIGTTTELKRRIRTLALRPENVVLLLNGGQQLEKAFHRQFADLRIGNSEWFAYDGPLIDFIHTQNSYRKDQDQ